MVGCRKITILCSPMLPASVCTLGNASGRGVPAFLAPTAGSLRMERDILLSSAGHAGFSANFWTDTNLPEPYVLERALGRGGMRSQHKHGAHWLTYVKRVGVAQLPPSRCLLPLPLPPSS